MLALCLGLAGGGCALLGYDPVLVGSGGTDQGPTTAAAGPSPGAASGQDAGLATGSTGSSAAGDTESFASEPSPAVDAVTGLGRVVQPGDAGTEDQDQDQDQDQDNVDAAGSAVPQSPETSSASLSGAAACANSANLCGGCDAADSQPGDVCGECGRGTLTCDGTQLICESNVDLSGALPRGQSLIDDFESDDGTGESTSGITGEWYLGVDGTGGWFAPGADEKGALLPNSPGAPDGTGQALHVLGQGFTGWGAVLGLSLNTERCTFDASSASGVRFYARGSGTSRFAVGTAQTVSTVWEGDCQEDCEDHFGIDFELTADWQEFAFEWGALSQRGFGDPTTFQPDAIIQLEFLFRADATTDLYLDTIQFF